VADQALDIDMLKEFEGIRSAAWRPPLGRTVTGLLLDGLQT